MQHNVRTTLYFYVLAGLGGALTDTVASNLLWELMGDNFWVGLSEGIQGLVQMLVAVPVGRYADKHGDAQAKLLARTAVLGVVLNLVMMGPLVLLCFSPPLPPVLGSTSLYVWLATCLALSGVFVGLYDPPMEALWANSLSDGEERTLYNGRRSIVSTIVSIAGPCVSLVVFFALGDSWSMRTMASVWLLGLILLCASMIPMRRFREWSAGQGSDVSPPETVSSTPTLTRTIETSMAQPLLDTVSEDVSINRETPSMVSTTSPTHSQTPQRLAWVPYVCLASNVWVALGSGMTVKFWGLFFENEVRFNSVQVNAVYIAQALALCAVIQASNWLRDVHRVGRLRLGMVQTLIGLAVQCTIVFEPHLWHNQWAIGALVVLRYAMMNASTPTIAAILTDHLPPEKCAIWAALDSITVAGWCGSAVLGGWFCDTFGYGTSFAVTLAMQTFGSLFMVPVLWIEY